MADAKKHKFFENISVLKNRISRDQGLNTGVFLSIGQWQRSHALLL